MSDLKTLFPNASKSTIARNPHGLGSLPAKVAEQNPVPPLVRRCKRQSRDEASVGVRVTIIACRRRLQDDQNDVASKKGIQDFIAASLGIDDADPIIRWEYGQIQTNASEGLLVKIEMR